MDIFLSYGELLLRLLVSLLYGAILGWDREAKRKAAGLRTHMMVALGSTSFTIATLELYSAVIQDDPSRNVDPLRIIEGVIGGIGFLGAGTIIRSRGNVEGVTTAATIWVVGSIGLACGGGYYILATAITGLAFIILTAMRFIEKRVVHNSADPKE